LSILTTVGISPTVFSAMEKSVSDAKKMVFASDKRGLRTLSYFVQSLLYCKKYAALGVFAVS
jgi:hypothetical protein